MSVYKIPGAYKGEALYNGKAAYNAPSVYNQEGEKKSPLFWYKWDSFVKNNTYGTDYTIYPLIGNTAHYVAGTYAPNGTVDTLQYGGETFNCLKITNIDNQNFRLNPLLDLPSSWTIEEVVQIFLNPSAGGGFGEFVLQMLDANINDANGTKAFPHWKGSPGWTSAPGGGYKEVGISVPSNTYSGAWISRLHLRNGLKSGGTGGAENYPYLQNFDFAASHRFSVMFDDDARRLSMWIDGVLYAFWELNDAMYTGTKTYITKCGFMQWGHNYLSALSVTDFRLYDFPLYEWPE